jgi:Ribosomal protein L22p/L17e
MQAAANAKNNLGLRKAKLYVSECMADGGPVLKRIRPRAKGRCVQVACLFCLHLVAQILVHRWPAVPVRLINMPL